MTPQEHLKECEEFLAIAKNSSDSTDLMISLACAGGHAQAGMLAQAIQDSARELSS
jgi:hypothetical protein